jgi:hypothetical protein
MYAAAAVLANTTVLANTVLAYTLLANTVPGDTVPGAAENRRAAASGRSRAGNVLSKE